MDVILNELSLAGQFEDEDYFLKNLSEIIMITHLINQLEGINLFKSYNIWDAKVTDSTTLASLLRKKGSDLLNKLRLDLSKLSEQPPYWEEDQIHDCSQNTYKYNATNICNTGLAESSERDKVIISFNHSSYRDAALDIMKNSTNIDINNLINLKSFSSYLYDHQIISEYEFCKYFFYATKLNFSKLDDYKRGFNTLGNDEKKQFIKQFKVFSEMSWTDILNSDGLEYKKYNNTLSGFTDIDIYKFRVNQTYRCFGYRKGEIFYIIHFETDHKLSDKG